jgi:hypothetical protein
MKHRRTYHITHDSVPAFSVNQSIEPGPELDAPMGPPTKPFEGHRLQRLSSEYDVERVLKQSEETARIERERQSLSTHASRLEERTSDSRQEEKAARDNAVYPQSGKIDQQMHAKIVGFSVGRVE